MPAPTMSHVICTGALIVLIFLMQFSYLYVVDNIRAEMARRELKEIADYVSDTLANLYFLTNSTNRDVKLKKSLSLPSEIMSSTYIIEIVFENPSGLAQGIHTYIKGKPWITVTSWLLPGLKVDQTKCKAIESGGRTVVAWCSRASMNTYVWIAYET